VENHIDLSRISSPTILYDGSATQAVTAFPKNVNVVASVSLAGIGFQRTQVRAIADPSIRVNIHNVQARGAFGELEITLRNIPSPQNPRTSILASSSAIAACLSLPDPIQIGVG
jgi:aspartate dehydrogenase